MYFKELLLNCLSLAHYLVIRRLALDNGLLSNGSAVSFLDSTLSILDKANKAVTIL